jgi:hypothetical protein
MMRQGNLNDDDHKRFSTCDDDDGVNLFFFAFVIALGLQHVSFRLWIDGSLLSGVR